jgi:hypothetical protein
MDGRWSGADASLAGDWAESLFHRLNIDPKQHKMRSMLEGWVKIPTH